MKTQTAEKKENALWRIIRKILVILVKILRWPVVYYGVLIGGFYGITWLFTLGQDKAMTLTEIVGTYGVLIGAILAIVMLLISVLTSTFFTETFLASTGLACGMYLLASLFITAPYDWGNDYVEFDAMKMYTFLALAAAVLIGDIIVLVFRKVLKKRSVQHMMKHT